MKGYANCSVYISGWKKRIKTFWTWITPPSSAPHLLLYHLPLPYVPFLKNPKVFFFLPLSSSNKSSILGFVTGEIFIQGETGRGVKGGLSCLSPGQDKSYWGADKLVHGRAQHGLGKVVVSGWKWDKCRRKEGRICGRLFAIRGCNLGVSLQAISAPSGRFLSHSHTPGPRHRESAETEPFRAAWLLPRWLAPTIW